MEITPPRTQGDKRDNDDHGENGGGGIGGDFSRGQRAPPAAQGLGAAEELPPKPNGDTQNEGGHGKRRDADTDINGTNSRGRHS